MAEITERHIPCEECGSSDARCNYSDGHGYCFSCEHYFPSDKGFNSLNDYTYEYLPWRGVSKETMAFYGVKTKIDSSGTPVSLGYQYPNGSYKVRNITEKSFHSVGDISKAGLFGRDKFEPGSHKYVTITEGELDALSLYQVLRSPVVSIQSAGTGVRDCAVDRQWLASFERVYLAFDADAVGHHTTAAVARLFDYDKVYHVRFSKRKDASEYLQHGESEELRNVWWNSKHYLPDSLRSSFSDFKDILTGEHKPSVAYPFPTLNKMTYGIRTGESVLITAQEGIGKTEVMHAIEYQLLRETSDNVGAIFLEEPQRRHLQSLAGIHLQRPAHLPDSGCTDDQVYSAIEEIVGRDDRLHVYSHFGSTDPEILLDTIRFLVSARGCTYILLDHISMAVSGSSEDDERRALDYLSTKLEMMVKELDFALIIVSHVNDFGQTRGSRWISKVADVKIALDRDIEAGSNIVTMKITKPSRFTGMSGPAGAYAFNPLTRRYLEVADDHDTGTSGGHRDLHPS